MSVHINSQPKIVTVGLKDDLGGRNQGGDNCVHYRPNITKIVRIGLHSVCQKIWILLE